MNITEAVSRLEVVLASEQLAQRDAARCRKLADALRRPARVCLIGTPEVDLVAIAEKSLDWAAGTLCDMPEVFELSSGPGIRFEATLPDGSTYCGVEWPGDARDAAPPVFLRLQYPLDALESMSFLALKIDHDPAMHRPALAWAARRSDIAVLCVGAYGMDEARIWNGASGRLRDHVYLLECGPGAAARHHPEFIGQFRCGGEGIEAATGALMDRLARDVNDARLADMDATRLFLHRLGLDAVPLPASAPGAPEAESIDDLVQQLSEPLIYLIGRAKALSEELAWMTEEEEWAKHVIAECCETAEALCDRTSQWSLEHPATKRLQQRTEAMREMMTLLQFEDGELPARQAAALMEQVRSDFERALAPSGSA